MNAVNRSGGSVLSSLLGLNYGTSRAQASPGHRRVINGMKPAQSRLVQQPKPLGLRARLLIFFSLAPMLGFSSACLKTTVAATLLVSARHGGARNEIPEDEAGNGCGEGRKGVVFCVPRFRLRELARHPSPGPQEHVR